MLSYSFVPLALSSFLRAAPCSLALRRSSNLAPRTGRRRFLASTNRGGVGPAAGPLASRSTDGVANPADVDDR